MNITQVILNNIIIVALDAFAIYAFIGWKKRKTRREEIGIPQNDDERMEAAELDKRLSRIDCKPWIYIILVVFNVLLVGIVIWIALSS